MAPNYAAINVNNRWQDDPVKCGSSAEDTAEIHLGKSSTEPADNANITWPKELMGNVSQSADNVDFIYILPKQQMSLHQDRMKKRSRNIYSFCNSTPFFRAKTIYDLAKFQVNLHLTA